MVFKKWQKPAKKKVEEVKEIVEETPVSSVIEDEIINDKEPEVSKPTEEVMWTIGKSIVTKPKGRIKFEAQVAPFPMFKLPEELRRWLVNNWLTTEVYKKDKEWLEKHNVDMKMVEKLKKFLTEVL